MINAQVEVVDFARAACLVPLPVNEECGTIPSRSDTVLVPLSSGFSALVDEQDLPLVSQFKWWVKRNGKKVYARTEVKRQVVSLHRLVVNAPAGMQVDHVNCDTLDCRRQNLRLATQAENQRNRRKIRAGASAYKGVAKGKAGKWVARIFAGRRLSLGVFLTEEEAARAYDTAAEIAQELRRIEANAVSCDREQTITALTALIERIK